MIIITYNIIIDAYFDLIMYVFMYVCILLPGILGGVKTGHKVDQASIFRPIQD